MDGMTVEPLDKLFEEKKIVVLKPDRSGPAKALDELGVG
jgi:hypothetical protein